MLEEAAVSPLPGITVDRIPSGFGDSRDFVDWRQGFVSGAASAGELEVVNEPSMWSAGVAPLQDCVEAGNHRNDCSSKAKSWTLFEVSGVL